MRKLTLALAAAGLLATALPAGATAAQPSPVPVCNEAENSPGTAATRSPPARSIPAPPAFLRGAQMRVGNGHGAGLVNAAGALAGAAPSAATPVATRAAAATTAARSTPSASPHGNTVPAPAWKQAPMRLERGPLTVDIELAPLSLTVRLGRSPRRRPDRRARARRRDRGPVDPVDRGRRGARGARRRRRVARAVPGSGRERPHFARPAAGPHAERRHGGDPRRRARRRRRVTLALRRASGRGRARPSVRCGASGSPARSTHSSASSGSARATALHVDQAGRSLQLGADRAYTGPDCPPDMLELGGIPQGDYAPVPWLLGSRGWAAWWRPTGTARASTLGDEVVLSTRARRRPAEGSTSSPHDARRPPARLPAADRAPACCPSGRTGTGRAATSTSTSATPRTTSRATAPTASRSTRSCSTRRGRRNTTRGSSTRTSSRTRAG